MADEEITSQTPPTYVEQMQARVKRTAENTERMKAESVRLDEVRLAEEAAVELRGHWADMGAATLRIAPSFAGEVFEGIAEIDEWSVRNFGSLDLNPFDGGDLPWHKSFGYISPASHRKWRAENEGMSSYASPIRVPQNGWDLITDSVPKPERFSGQFLEAGGKFVLGFIPANRALQATQWAARSSSAARLGAGMAAGAVVDFSAFDGHEGRMSDMVQASAEEGGMPDLSNAVTEYLASDPNDSELEGRLKATIEGGFLGLAAEGIFRGVKAIYHARQEAIITKVAKAVDEAELNPHVADEAIDAADAVAAADQKAAVSDALKADVKSTVDDNITTHATPAGKMETVTRGGETLQIVKVEVAEGSRGQGQGTAMYEAAARQADDQGLKLVSDTQVSESAARRWDEMARNGEDIIDQRKTNPDNVEFKDGEYTTKNGTPVFERVGPNPTKAADDLATARNTDNAEELLEIRRAETRTRVQQHMKLNPDDLVAFKKAVADGNEDEALQMLTDFNENTIDWSKIESADDIKQVLLATEQVFQDLIGDAKGGVQSNARTRVLANITGATGRDVHNLFRDVRGSGGLAARFYASMRTMMASAAEVKRAVKEARTNPQNAALDAAAVRAIQMHAAIQAEVKGAQTEIARALQAMSMIKESAANNFKEFDEIFRETGTQGRKKWETEMDKFLSENAGLAGINKLTQMTPWEKGANMFFEYTINAMLSSPKTHVVNFVSNVLNTVLYSLDRSLGGSYRFLRHGDRAALHEAKIDLHTKFTHSGRAWELARQAWREGAPVVDQRQRIEFRTRQSIGTEGTPSTDIPLNADSLPNFGEGFIAGKREVVRDGYGRVTEVVDFNTYQRIINSIGRIIRTPARALITGDEFFKAINREAEMQVQAFRQADTEAVEAGMKYGEDAYNAYTKKRVKKLTDETIVDTENINLQAIATDKARLTTFQESPRTAFGAKAEQLINSNRWVKLIFAPFFRTPMNILRQGVLDRTPLNYLTSEYKATMASGSPREIAEMQARSFTAVGAMTTFYMLTTSGEEGDKGFEIVGKLPREGSARHAGVKDYSVRLGDIWYQFNRLEPFGMWLGMVADMRTHTKYHADDDDGLAYTLAAGTVASFMNNVGGKTFMKSMSDFQDLLEGTSNGSKASITRAVKRFAGGEFGKLIPQFFKASAQATHDESEAFSKEAWDFIDILQARSHAFADDIALKFDVLGQPIPEDIGMSALLNPFAVSMDRLDDPVYKEFFDTGFDLRNMPKSLGGGAYQLNSEEYSKLNGYMNDTGVYQALTAMVTADEWSDFPMEMRKMLMKKIITESRQTALALFLSDPEMSLKLIKAKVDESMLIADFE